MVFLLKKINIDFTNRIALLVTLVLVENFKFCNKYEFFLARHFDFVIKKIFKEDFTSRLDKILQHCNLQDFTQLAYKNPELFLKLMQKIIDEIKKPE